MIVSLVFIFFLRKNFPLEVVAVYWSHHRRVWINRRTVECRQNKNVKMFFFFFFSFFGLHISYPQKPKAIKMINLMIMNNETSLNLLTFYTQSTTTSRKKKSHHHCRRSRTQSHFQARLSLVASLVFSRFYKFSLWHFLHFTQFSLVLVVSCKNQAAAAHSARTSSFIILFCYRHFYYYHYELQRNRTESFSTSNSRYDTVERFCWCHMSAEEERVRNVKISYNTTGEQQQVEKVNEEEEKIEPKSESMKKMVKVKCPGLLELFRFSYHFDFTTFLMLYE